MGSPTGTRREGSRRAATRRRILDAAAAVLGGDGLEASMETIAERAGVTRMTLYRHVGSRDELLVAVLLDQSTALGAELRSIFDEAGRPFTDRVVDGIVSIVLAVRSSPVLRLFVERLTPAELEALDRDERFLGRVWALLLPYFEAAEAAGELRNPAAPTLDWTLRQTLLQLLVTAAATTSEAGLREELHRFFVPSIGSNPPKVSGGRSGRAIHSAAVEGSTDVAQVVRRGVVQLPRE